MPEKTFDASLKGVIEAHAADWARLLGAAGATNVRVIDADVSTATAAADKAFLLEDEGDEPCVLHPELQSSYFGGLPKRIWWYNSVFHHRLDLPVLSVAVLLRPQADGPAMTGRYWVKAPRRRSPYHVFRYDVLRLWKMPVKRLLSGGVGILPLAPLADDAAARLPLVLRQIDERLKAEVDRDEAEHLRAATLILMGLRHPQDIILQAMKGLWPMWDHVLEDSSVVQEFIRRGEKRGIELGEKRGIEMAEQRALGKLRNILLRLGEKRFGPPDPLTRDIVESIQDSDRLALLSERVSEVQGWKDLLA